MRHSERNDGGGGGRNDMGGGRWGCARGIVVGRGRTDDKEKGRNGTRATADGVIYVEWNEEGRNAGARIDEKLLQLPARNLLH